MSTNEELAVRVRQGDKGCMDQLWEQVQAFVAWRAWRYYSVEKASSQAVPYEAEDLIQQGWFAVREAVNYYDPERGGNFLTVLDLTLKSAFSEVSGKRLAKQRNDALAVALSGDESITQDSDTTLLEMTADTETDVAGDVLEKLYRQELHEALEVALAKIPTAQADVLRAVYYRGKTQADIARETGLLPQTVSHREREGLARLYRARKLNGLNDFLDRHTDFFAHVGVTNFKSQGGSTVERIAERRERHLQKLTERLLKRATANKPLFGGESRWNKSI